MTCSIGRMAHGQQSYYLQAIANVNDPTGTPRFSSEDYYLLKGEAPGQWWGQGAAAIGLTGQVDVDGRDLSAVLGGSHPATGEQIGKVTKRPGFDVTLKADKSLSLLFAFGDDEVKRLALDLHDHGNAQALAYLEECLSYGRRGRGGEGPAVETDGWIVASFRQRTARPVSDEDTGGVAVDPHLHTHNLLMNRQRGVDGQWTGVDSSQLYRHAKTAGEVYHAAIRARAFELGVDLDWQLNPNGYAAVGGFTRGQVMEFSQRRRQVLEHLEASGLAPTAAAADRAAMATRQSKADGEVNAATLQYEWLVRGEAVGLSRDHVVGLVDVARARMIGRDVAAERDADAAEVAGRLVEAGGLTAHQSRFGVQEVIRGFAHSLRHGGDVRVLARRAAGLMRGLEVVALHAGGKGLLAGVEDRCVRSAGWYSTAELLAVERAATEAAVSGVGAGAAVVDAGTLAGVLEQHAYLRDEQRAAVEAVTTSGDRVSVVNALGGSGKTTMMRAAYEAWRAEGRPVIGACLSARAANVLRDETGMNAFTVAALRTHFERNPDDALRPGTVLVVDEAGQVGSRAMADLLARVTEAGGKLVCVGDCRQLPEVDAGGMFAGWVERLPVVEMVTNTRQVDEGERAVLLELRSGDAAGAVEEYDRRGQVITDGDPASLRNGLVGAWHADYRQVDPGAARAGQVLMLAVTNSEADDLNRRARVLLDADGALTGPVLDAGGREYQAGDHVVTRLNAQGRRRIVNGDRWEVVSVNVGTGGMRVQAITDGDPGPVIELAPEYVARHVHHAYAVTVNISQGSTFHTAHVLAGEASYREALYVGASRARVKTRFYVAPALEEEVCSDSRSGVHRVTAMGGHNHGVARVEPVQDPADRALAELAAWAGKSKAQQMAMESLPEPSWA